jgi:propionyl-CoA synthetase
VRHVTSRGNLARMSGEYRQAYDRSMTDPDGFWREAASLIDWYTEPETIMDSSALPFSRWFGGGELNTCHNCLDRHVDAGRGDQVALIHDSPVTDSRQRYTYAELRDLVARFAGVLRSAGVGQGDRVII